MSGSSNPTQYPEQHHAGKVGLGPNYHMGPTFGEKLTGLKDEIKGKLTHNPEEIQRGKDILSGEQKRRDREGDEKANPFHSTADPSEDTHSSQADKHQPQSHSAQGAALHDEKRAKEQPETVAPQGTQKGEMQSKGQVVNHVKHT